MSQIYIFIITLAVITIIIFRRNNIFKHEEKTIFKKKIANKIEEFKKQEKDEVQKRFKEDHKKEKEDQKFNIAKYKEEIRKADVAIARQEWSNAKKLLIQAVSLSENELSPSIKLAKVYLESGDIKRAEMLYKNLLESNTDIVEIYENLGEIYTKKRQYKDAIASYSRSVELNEKNDKNILALGKLYRLLMRYSLAAECFRRAAELKPRETKYLFLLAESCKEDGDLNNALFTYEKILTIEPYNEKAKSASQGIKLGVKEEENFFE